MNLDSILSTVWGLMNSPIGITVSAAIFLFIINRIYAARPAWAKYEGALITAVKYAERVIPDDTENSGMKKLDAALRYLSRVHEESTGKALAGKKRDSFKDGLQIIHDKLKERGTL